jgi:purine-binding chemotaxis protein CheW
MKRLGFAAGGPSGNGATKDGSSLQLFCFRVGEEEYAVDLQRVEEIVRAPKLARVPHSPPWIEGVINIRGSIVPVVDLRKRLGSGRSSPTARPKCILCRIGRDRVGIVVDSATEVQRVLPSDLRPVPAMVATTAQPFVLGVCGAEGRLTLLLDLKSLFARTSTLISDSR